MGESVSDVTEMLKFMMDRGEGRLESGTVYLQIIYRLSFDSIIKFFF